MSSHFLGSKAPVHVTVALEDMCLNHKCHVSPLLPLRSLLLSTISHGKEYPFGHSGSAVPAMFPPSLLPPTSLLSFGEGVGDWRESLAAV